MPRRKGSVKVECKNKVASPNSATADDTMPLSQNSTRERKLIAQPKITNDEKKREDDSDQSDKGTNRLFIITCIYELLTKIHSALKAFRERYSHSPKEFSKKEFSAKKAECLYAPMPSSIYGYAVNEMIMTKSDDSVAFVLSKVFELLVFVGPVLVLQGFLLLYLMQNSASAANDVCQPDHLRLRLIVLLVLPLNVIPSLRDFFVEFYTIFECDSAIIEVDDDLILEKPFKPFYRKLLASFVSCAIIIVEFAVWCMVIHHAVTSIMSAKDTDEIVGDGLAIVFINDIDNLAYSLLLSEREKNMHAKRLFRLKNWPSAEVVDLIEPELSIAEKIGQFFGRHKLNLIGVLVGFFKIVDICRICNGGNEEINLFGMGNASYVVDNLSKNGCHAVNEMFSFGNYPFLPYYLLLNRTCAPSYGSWNDNITAALMTGMNTNNELTMVPTTIEWGNLGRLPLFLALYGLMLLRLYIPH